MKSTVNKNERRLYRYFSPVIFHKSAISIVSSLLIFQILAADGDTPLLCDADGVVSLSTLSALQHFTALKLLYIHYKPTWCDVPLPATLTQLYMNNIVNPPRRIPPHFFVNLTQLSVLDIRGNNLAVFENPCLKNLVLRQDSTGHVCDCRMRYMKYISDSDISPTDKPCQSPPHLQDVEWQNISPEDLTCQPPGKTSLKTIICFAVDSYLCLFSHYHQTFFSCHNKCR